MRRRLGVAKQQHLSVTPRRAGDGLEVTPDGAVSNEPMAVERVSEYILDVPRAFFLAHVVEAARGPSLRRCFNHPSRMTGLILIGVRAKMARSHSAEEKGEGIQWPRRTEPGEFVARLDDLGAEFLGIFCANGAVDALRDDDEIAIREPRLDVARIDRH